MKKTETFAESVERMKKLHSLPVFGQNLIRLREREGMTRRELAEKLGINEGTLQGYETTSREPRFELLIKIANYFGVSVDDLLKPILYVSVPVTVTSKGKYISQTSTARKSFGNADVFVVPRWINFLADELKVLPFQNLRYGIFHEGVSTEVNLECNVDVAKINLTLSIEMKSKENDIAKEENVNGANVDDKKSR